MQKSLMVMVILVSLALAGQVAAQPGTGGGMGMGGGMGPRMYDPKTVTTVKGQVEKLQDQTMGRGGMGMTFREVILKTATGSILVHLAPAAYLEEHKFTIKAGDTLEVTGSQLTLNNQPAIIAKDVKTDGKTLNLRDDQGLPAWRGMGRGRGMGPGGGQGKPPAGM